jgi:hypothetical protein
MPQGNDEHIFFLQVSLNFKRCPPSQMFAKSVIDKVVGSGENGQAAPEE